MTVRMVNIETEKLGMKKLIAENTELVMTAIDKAKESVQNGNYDKAQDICFEVIKLLSQVQMVKRIMEGLDK